MFNKSVQHINVQDCHDAYKRSHNIQGRVSHKKSVHSTFMSIYHESPKGAKVYPASRRRSNNRVGLKGQLAPHCVP